MSEANENKTKDVLNVIIFRHGMLKILNEKCFENNCMAGKTMKYVSRTCVKNLSSIQ